MKHPYDIGTRVRLVVGKKWTPGTVKDWRMIDWEARPGLILPTYVYTVEDDDGKLWGEVDEAQVHPDKPPRRELFS